MSSVDNRVVNMQFNNRDFASKIADTMVSLQKLDEALKFEDGKAGLSDLGKSVNDVDFSSMESGISTLKGRFSTLGIAGMTAIQNITNSVINLAKNLASKAITGGITRAMNLQKADFMLQGIVKNEKEVKKIMNDVNDSVDGTAYSLDQAAVVAAQFAATGMRSGKELRTILKGVTGISAVFGADYQRVGEIFTQISAQNRVYANDINSLSSMGVNAKAALVDYFTEVEKKAGVTTQTIDDMIKKGQIDFKIFGNAMAHAFGDQAKAANRTFTGALSNVNAALSRLGEAFISPFVNNKKLEDQTFNLIDVLNTFRQVINNAKGLLDGLGLFDIKDEKTGEVTLGKWTKAVQKASEITTKFLDLFTGSKSDFGDNPIEKRLETFRKALGMAKPDFQNLKDTFSGIFSAFKLLGNFITSFIKALFPMSDGLKDAGSGFLAITGAIGRYLTNLEKAIDESGIFSKVFSGISFVIRNVAKAFSYIAGKIGGLFSGLGNGNKGFLNSFSNGLDYLGQKLKPLGGLFKKAFGGVREIIDGIFDGLGKALKGVDFDKVYSFLALGVSGGVGFSFVSFLNKLSGSFDNFLSGFSPKQMVSSLDAFKNSLDKIFSEMDKSKRGDTIIKIAKAIGILAASLFLLSIIKPERLISALGGLEVLILECEKLLNDIELLSSKTKTKTAHNMASIGTALASISVGLLIMSAAVKVLSTIPLMDLGKSLVAIGILMAELEAFMKGANGLEGKNIKKVSKALISMGAGLWILAQAVKSLAQLKLIDLAKGIGGIGVLLIELAIFMNLTKGLKVKGAVGLIGLSASLLIIAEVVKRIGKLKPETLAKGLTGLGFVLLELAAFIKLISGSKGVLTASVGMLVIAKAMESLTGSLKALGNFSEEQLARGLLSLGGSLVIIAGAMRLMPANMLTASAGLFIAAQAITEIAAAMSSMGGMKETEMAKSLVEMAGALGILALAMKAMSKSLSGAVALYIVSAALSVLVPILQTLGSMSVEQIANSLVTLAGAFIIIGVAGAVLSSLSGALALLGAAIALFGIGLLSAGAGVLLFVNALKLLSESVVQIVGAIPIFIETIVAAAPRIGFAGMVIVGSLLKAIADNIGNFASAAIDLVVNFVNAVSSKIGDVVDAGMNLAINFINGIANGIEEHGAELQAAIGHLVGSLIKFIMEALASIADAFGSGGKWLAEQIRDLEDSVDNVFGDGTVSKNAENELNKTADVVDKKTKKAKNSAKKNLGDIPKTVKSTAQKSKKEAGKFSSIEEEFDKSMKGTIKLADLSKNKDFSKSIEKTGKAYTNTLEKTDSKKSGEKVGKNASSGAGSQSVFDAFEQGGKYTGSGYVKGVLAKVRDAYDAGHKLGKASKKGQKDATGESSPAKEFIKGGEFSGEGYVIGMRKMIGKVYKAGYTLGDTSVNALKESFKKLNTNIDDIDTTPTIRPVLDLSNVKMGLNSIDSMFNQNQYALRVAGSLASSGVTNSRFARPMTVNANLTVNNADNGKQLADDFIQELEIYERTYNG